MKYYEWYIIYNDVINLEEHEMRMEREYSDNQIK